MKTMTAPIRQADKISTPRNQQIIPYVTVSLREVLALLTAVTAMVVIVFFSVWATGIQDMAITSAATWGIGLVFMAMAMDKWESRAMPELLSGTALMVLAWLQNSMSADFVILTALIIASWVSIGLYRLLR